jgi:hypothetical protein
MKWTATSAFLNTFCNYNIRDQLREILSKGEVRWTVRMETNLTELFEVCGLLM